MSLKFIDGLARARAQRPGGLSWREDTSVLVATPASAQRDGTAPVTLHWTRVAQTVAYTLYRVNLDAPRSRGRRLNRAPIVPVTKCADFCRYVLRGTDLWNQLCDGITALSTGPVRTVADAAGAARFDNEVLAARLYERPLEPFTRRPLRDLALAGINPCTALARGLTEAEVGLFDTAARTHLALRQARGLAFIDTTARAGVRYAYALRGVDAEGRETVLAEDIRVVAGRVIPPSPPSSVSLSAKDHKVLLRWNRNPDAHDYRVERSTHPTTGFVRIHAGAIQYDVTQDLDGGTLPASAGYLDVRHWDEDGLPISHDVGGVAIDGPVNGTTYHYRVAALNINGARGVWSPTFSAAPARTVPPKAPGQLAVVAIPSVGGLRLDWRTVTRDVDGRLIPDTTQTYEIHRAETIAQLTDLSTLGTFRVATMTANPTDSATPTLNWTDTDPVLVPAYGETSFCYRLTCVDSDGNRGAPSAVISGRVPDTRPPGPTQVHRADGHDGFIRVQWLLNSEPDVVGYQVFRGVCDHGDLERTQKEGECELVMVAQLSAAEAKTRKADTGYAYADDPNVPAGSPICYAYWVRAFDAAQNLYPGSRGCPASQTEYACARLIERTPPPAPVITRLAARERSVEIAWVASPVQDQRAFHVYRGDAEDAAPTWVGCVLLDGTAHPGPWTGAVPDCGEIPAQAPKALVRGTFTDIGLEPDTVYWYRVSALDWLGNESSGDDPRALPGISTFTYASKLLAAPSLLTSPPTSPAGCGLDLRWQPTFNAQRHQGFVVFRRAPGGAYRQVSGIVEGNTFADGSALRGVQYDYQVQTMDRRGRLSEPSPAAVRSY